ncbi:hypothetical protein BRE01_18340 [Brevibacillus reuszeri]|uniref:Major facilitator superfamily (MFS) profile domain-containing protein n=1 Tax=Brevibacillus reuszeri TaxID=54915 RepID=A0A0K9Z049_9BACL|nr:MFS transporter [Brevibacillus reuszeri]KNB74296.1 hypothetical protein ADS79_00850 [Brevibacillus reuszeri]MED1856182.1 MFS transporter [Brevibacillus reuszeri]GED68132.1 hypothetical protein BRE01_18340 [Brevibacillus reuszeri]
MTNDKSRVSFTILALVQSTLIFTIALIMIPMPKIANDFALSSSQLLLLQVAYGLPFSGLLLFGGRLADRYRGLRMFVIGLIVFGASSLFAAFSPSFEILVSMRFLQGIGGGGASLLGLITTLPMLQVFCLDRLFWVPVYR